MRRLTLSLIWCTTLGAACGITDPTATADVFALASIDDRALPARVGQETFMADTVRFLPGDEWRRVSVVELHSEGADPGPVRRESDGFVTRAGERIILDFECIDVIIRQCAAPDTLRPSGHHLALRANNYGGGPRPVFRFEPVD